MRDSGVPPIAAALNLVWGYDPLVDDAPPKGAARPPRLREPIARFRKRPPANAASSQ